MESKVHPNLLNGDKLKNVKEARIGAEKITSIITELSFLQITKNCVGIMKNSRGGVGGEVKEFIFYLDEI